MFKKADIILIVAIVVAALIVMGLSFATAVGGERVAVYVDNELFAEYSLGGNAEYVITTDYGANTIVISGGSVSIESADCPDKYCVSHIAIDSVGEVIVCLPHRLTVQIEGE